MKDKAVSDIYGSLSYWHREFPRYVNSILCSSLLVISAPFNKRYLADLCYNSAVKIYIWQISNDSAKDNFIVKCIQYDGTSSLGMTN